MQTFEKFAVVVVPFPFTDQNASKKRPALVLSSGLFNDSSGHCVLAMITTAKHSSWWLDVAISELQCAGLTSPSIVRMKLFTLDNRLIIRQSGVLASNDQLAVMESFTTLFGMRPMVSL